MNSEPQTVEELIERYDTDPLFHAIVNQVDPGGWTDDDGASHKGPTVFSARRASEIMSVVQPVVDALTERAEKAQDEIIRLRGQAFDDDNEHEASLNGTVALLSAERDRYRTVVDAFARRVAAIDYTKRHDCWWVNPFDSCEGCDCGWVDFAESLEALAALGTR